MLIAGQLVRIAPSLSSPLPGPKATELMWELKMLFDPENILNPGVILNKVPFCFHLSSAYG